jgi:transcriptional regulator with XRE-family HTH domain
LVALVKTLMTLRGVTQAELSAQANISRSALSRFFNETSDLRSDAMVKVLETLGADVNLIVKREIDKALGREQEISIGEDIRFLMDQAPPIARKTIADTLIATLKGDGSPDAKHRIARIKKYRDSIKTVRRLN